MFYVLCLVDIIHNPISIYIHIQRHIHKYVYAIYIHIHIYARIPKERENMLRVRGQESWAGTMLIGSSHGSSKSTSLGSRKSCSIMPRTIRHAIKTRESVMHCLIDCLVHA